MLNCSPGRWVIGVVRFEMGKELLFHYILAKDGGLFNFIDTKLENWS